MSISPLLLKLLTPSRPSRNQEITFDLSQNELLMYRPKITAWDGYEHFNDGESEVETQASQQQVSMQREREVRQAPMQREREPQQAPIPQQAPMQQVPPPRPRIAVSKEIDANGEKKSEVPINRKNRFRPVPKEQTHEHVLHEHQNQHLQNEHQQAHIPFRPNHLKQP